MSEMLEVAKEAVLEAGKLILSYRNKKHKITNKGRVDDFATEADFESEKIIFNILRKHYPNHGFIAEESGWDIRKSEYIWVIDPLDGTTVYSAGLPTFAVSLGLLKDSKPILGVINLPALKMLFWAEEGSGAYLNQSRVKVSNKSLISNSIIGSDLNRLGQRMREFKKVNHPLMKKVLYMPMLGSAATGIALVAGGFYDAYVHLAFNWDFAAGTIIVEEAGGKVTDYKGKPINWLSDGISLVASNGVIHDQIISLINRK